MAKKFTPKNETIAEEVKNDISTTKKRIVKSTIKQSQSPEIAEPVQSKKVSVPDEFPTVISEEATKTKSKKPISSKKDAANIVTKDLKAKKTVPDDILTEEPKKKAKTLNENVPSQSVNKKNEETKLPEPEAILPDEKTDNKKIDEQTKKKLEKIKQQPPVNKPPYPEKINYRLSQLYFALDFEKVEGIFVSYLPNIRYLTGFSGSSACMFIFKDSIHFITDDRYEEQIKTELYPLPNLHTHIARDIWDYVEKIELLKGLDSIAFESDRVSYYEAVETRNKLRPVKFKPIPAVIEPFTQAKAPEELAYIKEACTISEKVYDKMINFIQPGMTEKDVAIEIAYQGRKLGAEGDAFDIIVTSGSRGALVHGQPTDKKIRRGDIVIMDFGFKVNGYCSDITRTICVGAKPTREQKALYALLREAEMKAIRGVLPTMNGKNLDALARNVIKNAGYGDYFQHSLGHGLGLEPHEHPIITFRLDNEIIPEDAVLAIEPGVYLPNKYGMRIEDNIFVTKNGAIMLTNAPDELPHIL